MSTQMLEVGFIRRSRSRAPPRKGYVVNAQKCLSKASYKQVPPHPTPRPPSPPTKARAFVVAVRNCIVYMYISSCRWGKIKP